MVSGELREIQLAKLLFYFLFVSHGSVFDWKWNMRSVSYFPLIFLSFVTSLIETPCAISSVRCRWQANNCTMRLKAINKIEALRGVSSSHLLFPRPRSLFIAVARISIFSYSLHSAGKVRASDSALNASHKSPTIYRHFCSVTLLFVLHQPFVLSKRFFTPFCTNPHEQHKKKTAKIKKRNIYKGEKTTVFVPWHNKPWQTFGYAKQILIIIFSATQI